MEKIKTQVINVRANYFLDPREKKQKLVKLRKEWEQAKKEAG